MKRIVLLLLLLIPSIAMAQLDVAPMVTFLGDVVAYMLIIIAALMMCEALIMAWRYLRSAISRG